MIGLRSKSRAALPKRLEALAEAIELADDRLNPTDVAEARALTAKASERLRHGTATTLVALVGATGSGKSSVTNLLVGADVATAGVRRPTTSSSLACVFGDDDLDPVLDWLEVANRHRVVDPPEALDGMVLLDVPDFDSVATAHREEMERIAGMVDLLVWITDPEKYADKAMHEYLAKLAGHGAVMALALNKTDLISSEQARACRADIGRLLDDAGLSDAPIMALSAKTGQGADTMRAMLGDMIESKNAAIDRLAADTEKMVSDLTEQLGPLTGPKSVPNSVQTTLREDLLDVSGIEVVTDAVAAGYRRDAASKVGWPFTRWLRRLRPHPLRRFHLGRDSSGATSLPNPSGVQRARIGGAIRAAADAVSADLPDPWPLHVLDAASPDQVELADQLDQGVATAVRENVSRDPLWWKIANTVQLLLALTAIAGAAWLAVIAVIAYLQMPALPTLYLPEPLEAFPAPTAMLLGGLAIGFVLAVILNQVARLGGKRRARKARKKAGDAIDAVAQELVVEPIDGELDRRRKLHDLLADASA